MPIKPEGMMLSFNSGNSGAPERRVPYFDGAPSGPAEKAADKAARVETPRSEALQSATPTGEPPQISPGGWDLRLPDPVEPGGAEGGAPTKQKAKAARKRSRRRTQELAFLPAELEIMETPAHPLARGLALALCVFLVIAVAWSWIGRVDIVASAQGKLIPTGGVKVIQSREIGVVRKIHVQDGQRVAAGDVLIQLDPTENVADRDRLATELLARRIEIARLTAMLGAPDDPAVLFSPPSTQALTTTTYDAVDTPQLAVQRSLMLAQAGDYQAQLASFEKQAEQRQAQRRAILATVTRLEQTLPLIEERAEMFRYLSDKQLVSRTRFLELEQQRVEMRGALASERFRATEAAAALGALEDDKRRAIAALRGGWLTELAAAESAAQAIEQDLVKADKRRGLQRLVSPLDGVVTQLAVHTVGGVVTAAQPLMTIVPEGARLEVEAMVLNKDVGFVEVGQEVEIKIESFPFTKYGLIKGRLETISRDAITTDNGQLVYPARVSMEQTDIMVKGRAVRLDAGMAATVEVKTGERRLVEFLLAPLFRYRDESLRER